jgi:hypothetical protein
MADPLRSVSPEEAKNFLEFVKLHVKLADNMIELKNSGMLNEVNIPKEITGLMVKIHTNVT